MDTRTGRFIWKEKTSTANDLLYSRGKIILVDEKDVIPKIKATQEKMFTFCKKVISGKWKGYTGKSITHIVNIGIGGSGLGPTMAVVALRDYWVDGMKYYDVSNGDGLELIDLLSEIDIESSLFIVASKSFTTKETEENAMIAVFLFILEIFL